MLPGLCEEGRRLHLVCKQKAMELLGVEICKRRTIQAASRRAWLEVSRSVDLSRLAYEQAQTNYCDHARFCDICLGDIPQFYLLSAPEHENCSKNSGIS
jgi:hypothetical protein